LLSILDAFYTKTAVFAISIDFLTRKHKTTPGCPNGHLYEALRRRQALRRANTAFGGPPDVRRGYQPMRLRAGALQRGGKGSASDALLLRSIEEKLAHRLNVNRNSVQTAIVRLCKEKLDIWKYEKETFVT
jgi:hypothetical protein